MKVQILFGSKSLAFYFPSARLIYKTSTCNEESAVCV